MKWAIDLDHLKPTDAGRVGGKAASLAVLKQNGFSVPNGFCIPANVYRELVAASSLGQRIRQELRWKDFQEMRWEELWDTALRIRHLFAGAGVPEHIDTALRSQIADTIGDSHAAVRSSAIGEDSADMSFAGLHDSFIDISGEDDILDRIKRVWASLWSDAALLYRRELGLDVEHSAMAVVVQRFVPGECSGVVFSQSPLNPDRCIVEAVSGLAKGLVDGAVEPDRWEISREDGKLLSHAAPNERFELRSVHAGVRPARSHGSAQSTDRRSRRTKKEPVPPPLSDDQVHRVYRVARDVEQLFGAPQDVEWTFGPTGLQLLQARPVTAKEQDSDEKRVWHMSQRRSVQNLSDLRRKIEGSILPAMQKEAEASAHRDLNACSNEELAHELDIRQEAVQRWTAVYWDELIPFAHGMRLFGQIYNDTVNPDDPFSFIELLRPDTFQSLERNRILRRMAERIRSSPGLNERIRESGISQSGDDELTTLVDEYEARYGNLLGLDADRKRFLGYLTTVLFEMSDPARPLNEERTPPDRRALEQEFVNAFDDTDTARELLDLGRASYRIRDDDNIYLGRFTALLKDAEEAARVRIADRIPVRIAAEDATIPAAELAKALRNPEYRPHPEETKSREVVSSGVAGRQLVGKPAGRGIAGGPARVILRSEDLFSVKKGEVVVCDAIDPAMTFVAPLAAAIVERRGGMLIHGAIIAREYGIPCVTGIPNVTARIKTGARVTVDGYLGIVIVGEDR